MDNSAYDDAIGKRQAEIKKKFIETLREAPIVEYACKKSGIGRTTYYRWRKEDVIFAKECDEARQHGIEFINDMSESQMIQLIREKKMPAIAMWLKHNSPRYRQVPRLPAAPMQPQPYFKLYELVKKLEDENKSTDKDE
jgi:hypothetical protein